MHERGREAQVIRELGASYRLQRTHPMSQSIVSQHKAEAIIDQAYINSGGRRIFLLFNAAVNIARVQRVGQGSVTRVASGCTDEEQQDLQRFMDLQPERFRVHFTPDYSIDPETGEMCVYQGEVMREEGRDVLWNHL